MSGPIERSESRTAEVGGLGVRRALPRRGRRTVGAWCFVDHFGPSDGEARMLVGPHPHIGLATVTWLVEGEVVHRDSLGTEQPIRPGQLNLMTAGRGVSHAEESGAVPGLHGAQLWIAQPDATRVGPPAFEHHGELPLLDEGPVEVRVLVGSLGEVASPARADTELLGAALVGTGDVLLPIAAGHEHCIVVLDGAVVVGDDRLAPGELAYLAPGRDELPCTLEPASHALLLGGAPFAEPLRTWWNFVGRSLEELDRAGREWNAGDARFGAVASDLPRVPAPASTR